MFVRRGSRVGFLQTTYSIRPDLWSFHRPLLFAHHTTVPLIIAPIILTGLTGHDLQVGINPGVLPARLLRDAPVLAEYKSPLGGNAKQGGAYNEDLSSIEVSAAPPTDTS